MVGRWTRKREGVTMAITAIPTTYRGIEFRSRLEAKWAAMFDGLEWQWEYEPIDLNGYIPDFILLFRDKEILVEVKPAMSVDELWPHVSKIDESGWDGEVLIVGASVKGFLGLLREDRRQYVDEYNPNPYWWNEAYRYGCEGHRGAGFGHLLGSWHCRVCGEYDGNGHMDSTYDIYESAWAQATNAVKYRHGKR